MLPLATPNLRNVQLDRMSSVVSTIAMFTDKVLDLSDLCAFSIIPVESQCIYTYAVIVEINFHSLTTQDFGGLYVYVRLPVFSVCSVHFGNFGVFSWYLLPFCIPRYKYMYVQ